jgi:hypothetical protein
MRNCSAPSRVSSQGTGSGTAGVGGGYKRFGYARPRSAGARNLGGLAQRGIDLPSANAVFIRVECEPRRIGSAA